MTDDTPTWRPDDRLKRLEQQVRPRYDNGDQSHDFAHVRRVMRWCTRLGESAGADLAIVLPAALLHDVVNVPKNHPDRINASAQAAGAAKALLRQAEYSEDEIARIAVVITEHSYSLGKAPSCVESAVLQDADRLDAIGAIGVMRTVSCGCMMGSRYYDETEPFAKTRPLDDKTNTLDHFYVKLLGLAERMNTDAGKREAAARHAFMLTFLRQVEAELG